MREYQVLIDKAIAQTSKSNYKKTIELIDVCATDYLLDEETRSQLILKQAILLQENGDKINAVKALNTYKNLTKQDLKIEYYLCKAKLISQVTNDPNRLSSYLGCLQKSPIFKTTSGKQKLVSLYWRTSVLWQTKDFQRSDLYLSMHRNLANIGTYQNAHNHNLIGFSSIIKLANEQTAPNKKLADQAYNMLIQSFSEYVAIRNFRWLNKCVISNLLMIALFDYLKKSWIKAYKKVFYVRKFFYLYKIDSNDEAISEILSVVRKAFPEIFEILFSTNIMTIIKNHAFCDFLKEIYLEVEYEFIDFDLQSQIDISSLFIYLVT